MSSYIALMRKEEGSDFGVDFPDFPGCVTAGKNLEDARRMAEEALRFHAEGLLEDGESLPEPSNLETVTSDPANQDAVAFLVSLPPSVAKTVRVNISVPEPALRRIDDYARSHGLSRSAFLTRAALRSMAG